MPRTRPELDRVEKQTAILHAAVEQLESGGYAALSVAAIARDLGLAQNAVYWYFPTKDHLFVAALQQMGHRVFAAKMRAGRDWTARLLAVVDALADLYPLLPAIHQRAAASDVVRVFERDLINDFRGMLAAGLTGRVAPDEVDLAAETVLAAVIGAYAIDLSSARRRRLLRNLLDRLASQ
jgi:TetR/AcrR family transcriptional regulator, cholesterol catabolism regulator